MQRTIERCVLSFCIFQKWTCDLRFCETWNFVQFILRSYWRGFLLVNKCTASQSTPWNKHCQVSTTAREEGSPGKLAISSSNLAIQTWNITKKTYWVRSQILSKSQEKSISSYGKTWVNAMFFCVKRLPPGDHLLRTVDNGRQTRQETARR